VVQSDVFNRSRLATVTVLALTSNIRLVDAPGNVLLPAKASGLPRDSVANVTQLLTVNRELLTDRVGTLPADLVRQINAGLRFALEV
jgi:mRNA interferase MazF